MLPLPTRSPWTARRLQAIPPTIFAEMSALAVRTGSINLGQGFPDTDGPESMVEEAVEALRGGRNQYPPGPGVPELRSAIAAHQRRLYGLDLDPDTEVLVTAGATEAIAAAILALVEPGDEVIALEPYYDSYAACIAMAGGIRVPSPCARRPSASTSTTCAPPSPTDQAAADQHPHNPTGTVLTREELDADRRAGRRARPGRGHRRGLRAPGLRRPSTCRCHVPGMRERTVTISSAGKTFSFTGWKVGWVTGPHALVPR